MRRGGRRRGCLSDHALHPRSQHDRGMQHVGHRLLARPRYVVHGLQAGGQCAHDGIARPLGVIPAGGLGVLEQVASGVACPTQRGAHLRGGSHAGTQPRRVLLDGGRRLPQHGLVRRVVVCAHEGAAKMERRGEVRRGQDEQGQWNLVGFVDCDCDIVTC